MFFDCLACWASFTGYYLNQNNSLSLITFPVLCFSAKGEWMTIMLICLLWILNLSFCDNSNPWLFLESTVPGLAVTISHVPLSSAASSSFSYPQKWLCVFVLCSVNVFVKKMRVHDLAIPPVTSNLTAQSARATTSHTQCEMTAFNTCEGYVIWQQFKRGQREDFFFCFTTKLTQSWLDACMYSDRSYHFGGRSYSDDSEVGMGLKPVLLTGV